MTSDAATILEVERKRIGTTRLIDGAADVLDDGQIRLRIDHFAITANNITYAVFGDALAYWEFFPTELPQSEPTWGRVPAMGWAEVVESNNDDIAVGRRFYGWYPMASSCVVNATATTDGFRDDGAHRQPHAAVYRAYIDTESDSMYDPAHDGEDRHALLRGLFLTGFLAEEFFADGGGGAATYFGADQVIVLSASSKTAIGFAQRAKQRGVAEVIGATSPGNVDFVSSLGYYDTVVAYDDITTLDGGRSTVSIDMAGNPDVLSAVHQHFGDQLQYSMTVGRSHHDAPPPSDGAAMAGPAPQLFFAPSEVGRRMKEWGRDVYAQRCADAMSEFARGSRDWLDVEHRFGPAAAQQAWTDVHDGNVTPNVGIIASLHPDT